MFSTVEKHENLARFSRNKEDCKLKKKYSGLVVKRPSIENVIFIGHCCIPISFSF